MMIVGLTGSIGMGKSTAARMLRQMGVPVYDADAAVHALQAPGGAALPPIEAAFPGVVKNGVLDRQALGARVFGNKQALRTLEAIVHPLVGQQQRAFLKRAAQRGDRGQSPHRGAVGVQTSAPSSISAWLNSPTCRAGKIAAARSRGTPSKWSRRIEPRRMSFLAISASGARKCSQNCR